MKCKFHHLKIFCALQIGYFKTVKIFNILDWENIKEEDIISQKIILMAIMVPIN
jgi:hypothetical protein